jgi:hypothetical protein
LFLLRCCSVSAGLGCSCDLGGLDVVLQTAGAQSLHQLKGLLVSLVDVVFQPLDFLVLTLQLLFQLNVIGQQFLVLIEFVHEEFGDLLGFDVLQDLFRILRNRQLKRRRGTAVI